MHIEYYSTFVKKACFFVSLFPFLISCQKQKETNLDPFEKLAVKYASQLTSCIDALAAIEHSTKPDSLQANFLKARTAFKAMEPVLAFVDVNNYQTLNQPNLLKVEEEDLTDIKIKEPIGFQVLEESIYTEDSLDISKIRENALMTKARLGLIRANAQFDRRELKHFLGMLRTTIIRTATTGITGYDSPVLQQSLEEAITVYKSLGSYLIFFRQSFKDPQLYNDWQDSFVDAIDRLSSSGFDDFDRYAFIRNITNPQLALWNKTVADWGHQQPIALAISEDADNLFSDRFFNIDYFRDHHAAPVTAPSINLGKSLFYDEKISGKSGMSCASCHKPELAFTDGHKIAIGNDGTPLKRNSPTLLYAAYQKGFFYDKRAGGLEGQITSVMKDEKEFHVSALDMTSYLVKDSGYVNAFKEIYEDEITDQNTRNAIANYIRSLAPFESKFDKNMRGEEETLTAEELRGFNLFMGKAACATCHFPPLFNGLVPTRFNESELESIGVPETKAEKKIDSDLGRYEVFKTPERKHFFKTPTIRNIALTAPYMHNGVYTSLAEVMAFYNAGGGEGLGYPVPLQTLPAQPLKLTTKETESIISFLNTLTDETTY